MKWGEIPSSACHLGRLPLIKSRSSFLSIRFTPSPSASFPPYSWRSRSSTSYVSFPSPQASRRRRWRKVNGVASDVLFTALLQSQLVAYPAASHRFPRHRRFLHPLPLFRDPGFHRGSSTSVRRVVRLKVSRSLLRRKLLSRTFFHPLDVLPSSPMFLRFLFRLVLVSRAFLFSRL